MNRLTLLLALPGVVASLGGACTPPFPQAKACEVVIEKYFSEERLADANATFGSFADVPFEPDAEDEIRQAYDVDGSCWRTTPAIAQECERRCRAFLTADCFEGFGPGGENFADNACNFPERCNEEGGCSHGQECETDSGCCAAEPPDTPENNNVDCADYDP